MRNLKTRYYELRNEMPDPTCPDLNLLKSKLTGDKEAEKAIERLRGAHNSLRNTCKALLLLCLEIEDAWRHSTRRSHRRRA